MTRFRMLDGLRGVAAIIVVIHHALLLYPPMYATYTGTVPVQGSALWWATHTPLKLFTAGGEAVIIFFVLSGFVLTLLALKPSGIDWMAYYPQRVLRLMIPVAASILLASVWVIASNQTPWPGVSPWVVNYSMHPFDWMQLVRSVDLMSQAYTLNNPTWSLLWEIFFSLCLPLVVGLALFFRRRWYIALVAAGVLVGFGAFDTAPSLRYLPDFFVGAVLAVLLPHIRQLAERVGARRWRHVLWPAVLVVSLCTLILSWLTAPLAPGLWWLGPVFSGLQPLAAGAIVVVCIVWRPIGALLTVKPIQWAGTISFSLYLVHAPILVFSRYTFAALPLPLTMVIAVTLSLIVAVAFYWLIEARAHQWSRRAGARIAAAYNARAGRPVEQERVGAER